MSYNRRRSRVWPCARASSSGQVGRATFGSPSRRGGSCLSKAWSGCSGCWKSSVNRLSIHNADQALEVARVLRHQLDPIVSDPNRVRVTESAQTGHIDAGLHAEDHARRHHPVIADVQEGRLVDFHSQPMAHVVAPGLGDALSIEEVANSPVDIRAAPTGLHRLEGGLLCAYHELEPAPLFGSWLSHEHRALELAPVAPDQGRSARHQHVACAHDQISIDGVWERGGGADLTPEAGRGGQHCRTLRVEFGAKLPDHVLAAPQAGLDGDLVLAGAGT